MACEGPICKVCDEWFKRRTVMKKETTEWLPGYEHLNPNLGWACPHCLRGIDFCPDCGSFIVEDDYRSINDPDPQCIGYVCHKCGFKMEY